jgi:hypothetical protein
MPALPRRSWWSASCRPMGINRHDMGPAEARKNFVDEGVGVEGGAVGQRPSPTQMRRMGDSRGLERASTSPWTRSSRPWSPRPLCKLVRTGPDLPWQALGELGPGADVGRVRPRSGKRGRRWLSSGTSAYPLSDGSGSLTVATTRPETLLGDVAVMVHPEDERYTQALIGKTVKLPLVRPRHSGDRRRLRGPRFRHRCGQGHARARHQRLRRGPAPRPAASSACCTLQASHQRQRAGQAYQRHGPVCSAQGKWWPTSKPPGLLGGSEEAQAHGAALRAHRPSDRTHAHRPVVRGHAVQGQREEHHAAKVDRATRR